MTADSVTPPGDTDASGATAAPSERDENCAIAAPQPLPEDPGATFSPGRFVNPDSRAAAYLKATGLKATAIPRAIEGGPAEVTEAEVLADLARRGAVVQLPDPLPPPSEAKARALVRTMQGAGAFLMKVHPGRKNPVGDQWQHQAPISEDEAVAWLRSGGNLGVHPVRSGVNGWLIIDAESAAATQFFLDLGLTPTARTAKSRHPLWPEKAGGSHFWIPLPADVDRSRLQSKLGVKLPGGGVVDLLFTNNAVAPGSRIDSAPGRRYVFDESVNANGLVPADVEAVRFLVDPDAPLPGVEGVDHLRATMVKQFRAPKPHDPDADRVTQEIDEIPWETWLAGYEDKVQIIGADGSCGCPVFHWWSASTGRSGLLHEGCEYGWAAHIYSASLLSEWDCSDHLSRLRFRAHLEGRPHKLADVARGFGVNFSKPLNGVDLSGFVYRPAEVEVPTTPAPTSPVAGVDVCVSPASSRHLKAVPSSGTVDGDQTAALDDTAPSPADGGTGVPTTTKQEDTGLAMFRKLDEINESGFWDESSFLAQVHSAALSNGVYPWGLLGAVLPRVACNIPPNVRLVNSSGREGGRSSGTSLNLSNILFGAPEAGKSETIKIAEDLIVLPPHAKSAGSGTGEGIIKSFAYMKKASGKGDSPVPAPPDPSTIDGLNPGNADSEAPFGSAGGCAATGANSYEMVHITDTVMCTIPEVSDMAGEMNRKGTKLTSVVRKAWMGEAQGSTTGEIERRTHLNPHSYRLGMVIGAQISNEILDPLIGEGDVGTPQRMGCFAVKTIPAVGEPVTRINLPSIDWCDGQPAAAHTAQLTGSVAPKWIRWSLEARREIEAAKAAREETAHLAFSVQEAQRQNEQEELFSTPHGHELLHQLKLAAVLAVGEGLAQFEDRHWALAAKIMEARSIVLETVMAVLEVKRHGADHRLGQTRGRMQAAAKMAEAEATQTAMQSVCDTILRLVDAAADPDSDPEYRDQVAAARAGGKVKPKARAWEGGGVNTSYLTSWITGSKRCLIEPALLELRRRGTITSGHIIRRVPSAPAAVTAAPPAS